jgi:hypothetical protein
MVRELGSGDPGTGNQLTQFADPDGHPSVLAYRMGKVEEGVNGLRHQLDLITQNYPTQQTIQLIIDPLMRRVETMENEKRQEEVTYGCLVSCIYFHYHAYATKRITEYVY